ncbi:MAG: TRAP C4-dicarboxylate transporter [Desulfobacterales bacterium PC51MH44]|jgi:TRAP-type C4-dicarboxylate transport system permease small subunit|nr:MAG: TRAP C4-dicarboxylate transporter [Desulfobacterales bacterium PC51MH44]
MAFLENFCKLINQIFIWTAGFFLSAMIVLTCANIFFRLIWGPIRGTYELMGYFGAIVTAFALGYTQIKKGHISVDILVLRFSAKTQRALQSITNVICMIFFGMAALQIAKYANILRETGEVTETLLIIYYPFTYGAALGCAALSLVFFTELLNALFITREEEQ